MKNKHLSKAIASQKFFELKTKLMSKCKQNNIELRIVDRFYPSSKTCSQCGKVKKYMYGGLASEFKPLESHTKS